MQIKDFAGSYAQNILFELNFVIKSDAPTGTYTLALDITSDPVFYGTFNDEYSEVHTEVVDGGITISSGSTLNAQVFGQTLTLDGQIGLNTYILFGEEILEDKDNYQVEFYKGDTLLSAAAVSSVTPTERSSGGVAYTVYPFTVTTVAKEMDTVFTLKIKNISESRYIDFANSDGSAVEGTAGLDYAILTYLEDRIANSSDNEMVALAKDMKNYGVYAKHYFDVRDNGSTDSLPVITDFETITAETLADYLYFTPANIPHFTYKGTTLMLEEDTAFRLYFQSDDRSCLTVKIGDTVLPINSGKGMYYVEIAGIPAQNLDEMYDFTITNGKETVTAHHGPMGYAYWALSSSSNENLRRTMMALWHYNQAAKAYFN